jgi:cytohesin
MERLIRREVPAHTIAAVIEAGMDPVKVDESGKSLLHVAVELGQVDLVNRLVSMGVDPQSVHTSESPATESSATDPADTGSPSLFWIRAGYSPEARSKLEAANANIRIGADERHELLFKAAQEGVEGMINLLLMRGADVNGRDGHGKSVLWKAVREGAGASVVETLLEAGATLGRDDEADGEIDSHRADDSNPSNNRYNVLSAAVWNGDVEVMQLLLQAGGQPNATGRSAVNGQSGRTPLHEAAEAGNIDMMRLLLRAGGRPDLAGRSGKTPLHDAAESGNIDMMRLLLQAGGRPDASTQSGRTPLHEAAEAGSVDAVRLLMDEGAGLNDSSDGRSPLHYAAKSGSADLVQFLIEQGADPAKTDESGNTPLHLGAKHGPVVHALLKAGADVTSTNDRQNTPLHHAAPCAYYASDAAYPAMKRLIAAGADVNAANADGKTPLHRAVSFGAYQAMKHLIAAGADANAVDSDGETPLHKYLNMMHTGNDFVDVGTAMLLEAGADVNVTDTDGKTPLHLASDYGMASAVRLLLDAGADVSAVADYPESDLKGHTPLHRVADADAWYLIPDPYVLLRIAIDLIRAGADPAATTQDGTTPVELARQYDDEPMIQLLTDAGPESDIGVAP